MTDLYPNLEITPEPHPPSDPIYPPIPTSMPSSESYIPPSPDQSPTSYVPPTPTTPPLPETTPQEAPLLPVYVPKPKSPLGPILIGFFFVIFLAGVIGVMYFQAKFTASTPSPSPTVMPMAIAPSPTIEPSASPSATPKATKKPVSVVVVPTIAPTPTPIAQPSFDIRFGNPSTNVKQTIDEGKGDGRVINREYTSIQSGQFDEVASSWSPRVTVCYHIVAGEDVAGKNIKFSFSLDDKVEVEDNLGTYDKLEAGRLYDWCHDVTTSVGKHTAKLTLNQDKSIKESNYTNNLARVDWENLSDKIAPNFTLVGPVDRGLIGTCILPQYISDNVNTVAELKVEQKIDEGSWTTATGTQYCVIGNSGASSSYTLRITDTRGNINEQKKTFILF